MDSTRLHRRWLGILSIASLVLLLAGAAGLQGAYQQKPLAASTDLAAAMRSLAEEIHAFLQKHPELEGQTLAVGQFTGPRELSGTSGPGMVRVLQGELKKLRPLQTEGRPALELMGSYRGVTDSKTKVPAVHLTVRLVERSTGRSLGNFEHVALGAEPVLVAFAPTVNFAEEPKAKSAADEPKVPPTAETSSAKPAQKGSPARAAAARKEALGNSAKRNERLMEGIAEPRPHVNPAHTRVQGGPHSPYGLEILVATDPRNRAAYQPRAVEVPEGPGNATVPLHAGECYAIRLINDSDYPAVAKVFIDGLSLYAFSEEEPYRYVYLPKRSHCVVYGWYRRTDVADAFRVDEYSKAPEGRQLHGDPQVGTITVRFAAAWGVNDEPPPDEPVSPNQVSKSANVFTNKGEQVAADFEIVEFYPGIDREVVSVQYSKRKE